MGKTEGSKLLVLLLASALPTTSAYLPAVKVILPAPLGISGLRVNNVLYSGNSLTSFHIRQHSLPLPAEQNTATCVRVLWGGRGSLSALRPAKHGNRRKFLTTKAEVCTAVPVQSKMVFHSQISKHRSSCLYAFQNVDRQSI